MKVANCTFLLTNKRTKWAELLRYRARQLYKNISMSFLFPVKDGKHSSPKAAVTKRSPSLKKNWEHVKDESYRT